MSVCAAYSIGEVIGSDVPGGLSPSAWYHLLLWGTAEAGRGY